MAVEQALCQILKANTGVAAIVADRVYPGSAPQGAGFPRIEYGRLGTQIDIAHDGRTGVDRYVFDVHCSATTYEEAKGLAEAVAAAFDPNQDYRGLGIGVILPDDEFDTHQFADDGADTRIRSIVQQFIVWAW